MRAVRSNAFEAFKKKQNIRINNRNEIFSDSIVRYMHNNNIIRKFFYIIDIDF